MRTGVNTTTLLDLASGVRFLVCRSWDGKMAVYAERWYDAFHVWPHALATRGKKTRTNVSRGLSPVRLHQPGGLSN